MKYVIDKEKRPVYLQLYNQIREGIVNDILRFDSKLPSIRALAEELGISTVTVEHAYALLSDEGYVESRERSGYVISFRKADGFASPAKTTHKYHPATETKHAYPDFPLSVLSKTMRKILTEHGDLLLEKSPNYGCTELREAIKQYLARNRGISVDTEQIIIGSGSEYLYEHIIMMLGRSHTYGIESPSYKKIEEIYHASEVSYELLPLSHDGIDSATLSNTTASVIHTTHYRSFPTGVSATASKLHEYVRWANQKNRYIIEDDFESEFSVSTKPTDTLFALSKNDNVIYLNTFSKTISPSLRIGYMVLPKHLVKTYEEKLGFYSCTVPTYIQFVLAELIANGDFERHINRVRRQKRKEM